MAGLRVTDGLVAALARAQAKFPPIVKSHSNPAFKGSQYADVADVLAAVRPVLAAEGIVVTQTTMTSPETGGVELITKLLLGEEYLASVFPLPVQGLTAQQVGSLLTYHRRYQLCALLGVHPVGDDDDGNLAATAAPEPVEAEDVARTRHAVWEAIAELSDADKELVKLECRNQKVPSLRKPGATRAQLDSLVEFLAGLAARTEPFDTGYDFKSDDPSAAHYKPEPEAIPFEPVIAGAAGESATVRRQRNAIAKETAK